MQLPVYLDYAASTPVDPAVAALMNDCLGRRALAANPAALGHAAGRAAQALVEKARAQVAALVNAQPAEIIFTSGATESDNLAVIGTAQFRETRGRHLVTALTEHKAVIESCRHLAARGWRITWLRPDADGLIAPAAVEAALEPDTVLVSLMHVNNETGVILDVGAIGAICRRHDVLLHVDAAQSAGREVIDVRAQQIDLLSLSAHKLYGPKGVGALFIDQERVRRVAPLLFGGGQERGLRPGTVATHQVAGMGEAFRLAAERLPDEAQHVRALRDRLWAGLQQLPGILLNGHVGQRSGHILNVSVAGVEGESLFYSLGGLCVASGSACTSLSNEASPVLRALGRPVALAQSSIRFSFGRASTAAEIDFAVGCVVQAVAHLRSFSPVSVAGG
ncbi:MAG: aminotransferase class V-fold PLP-dependent enzyme [Gammaproteobacteria bacterium]|nr:aminotransferase class V-fold PLP-dependent enzyme [Gammaproteobacteria bacterium]